MAESLVNVTEGSGKKLHTWSRTIGANTVEDEVMLNGEPYLATYTITPAAVSVATATDHILQIMAGASLNVYLRRLRIWQLAAATTGAITEIQLLRVTTAGTGGTAVTPAALDGSDAAAGAAGMTIPTVKGTEGSRIGRWTHWYVQTIGAAGGNPLLVDMNWDIGLRSKPPRIAAGTSNGLVVKNITATAAATVIIEATIVEANF